MEPKVHPFARVEKPTVIHRFKRSDYFKVEEDVESRKQGDGTDGNLI
jgi:hypothetical protein